MWYRVRADFFAFVLSFVSLKMSDKRKYDINKLLSAPPRGIYPTRLPDALFSLSAQHSRTRAKHEIKALLSRISASFAKPNSNK